MLGSNPHRGMGNLGSVEFIVLAPSSWSDERQTAGGKSRTRLTGARFTDWVDHLPEHQTRTFGDTHHSAFAGCADIKSVKKIWGIRTNSGDLSR
ncbi:MAG: hypothetical protein M3325_05870, partial [Actinomycetota bacterium]|nr:hypothetical protein [Actinomycetota bacterium]